MNFSFGVPKVYASLCIKPAPDALYMQNNKQEATRDEKSYSYTLWAMTKIVVGLMKKWWTLWEKK